MKVVRILSVQGAHTVLACGLAVLAACATPPVDPVLEQAVAAGIAERGLTLNRPLIDRFDRIAFGSEYSGDSPLVSWNRPVTIQIVGQTSAESLETVNAVISDLDELLLDTQIRRVEENGRIQMAFTNQIGFERNAPQYAHDNAGYFYISWDPKTRFVTGGKILIRADGIDQQRRDHIIREEITQALGLMRDIEEPGSIFSQSDPGMLEFSPLDRDVIRLWEALRPLTGHDRAQVMRVLERLHRSFPRRGRDD